MAQLTWGSAKQRKVETGISKGVLYPNGGTGVAWNGLISVSSSPDGAEDSDLYANNILYAKLKSAESYKGTIEAYTYPKEFEICDGQHSVAPGVSIGQQIRDPFNFCYRTEIYGGNRVTGGYKLHLIYNARVTPSQRTYETINESPDAITLSWDFTTTPVVVDGFKPFSEIIVDTTEMDWINLEELEKIIYGLGADEPTLPSPDFILNIINMNKVARMIVDVISLRGYWIWDEFNFETDTVPLATDRESLRHVQKGSDFDVEFIQPTVFYSLMYADKDIQKFSVTVVDTHNPSDLCASLEEHLNLEKDLDQMSGMWIVKQDAAGYYYYPYILTI